MKMTIKLLNKIWSHELAVPKKKVRTTPSKFSKLKRFRKLHPELSMTQCIELNKEGRDEG